MLALTGHTGLITALAYSPDSRTLASSSADQTVRLWDLATGSCVNELALPGTVVHSLAFAPDGRELALGTTQLISVWIPEADEVHDYSRPLGGSCTVAYVGASRVLACGSYLDRGIGVIDRDAGRQVAVLGGLSHGILALTPARTRPFLAAGGGGPGLGELCVWEVPPYQPLFHRQELPQAVYALAFSLDGGMLASAGRDGVIRVWNPLRGSEIVTLQDSPPLPRPRRWEYRPPSLLPILFGLAFSSGGETLLAARNDGAIRFWDVASGQLRSEMNWKIGNVRSLVLAPDGMTAAAGGSDSSILVWDLEGM